MIVATGGRRTVTFDLIMIMIMRHLVVLLVVAVMMSSPLSFSFTSIAVDGFQQHPTTKSFSPSPSCRDSILTGPSLLTASSSSKSKSSARRSAIPLSAVLGPEAVTGGPSSALISLASSPVGAITVLAGIILVHEAGHYLAARSFNVSVEEFSIGFGPRLVGFSALGNEFNLRALPLGGYVKFPPNFNTTLVEEQQNAAREAYKARVVAENWSPQERLLNLATLGVWDERRRQKRKREQQQEQQAAAAAAQSPTTSFLTSLANKLRRGKMKESSSSSSQTDVDPEDYEIEYFDDPTLLQNRPWQERAVVLSGGVIFNLLLSFMLYFGAIYTPAHLSSTGLPRPVFQEGVVVSAPPVANGAASTLLQQGDIITSINGRKLTLPSSTTSSVLEAQQQVSDVISTIRKTPDGGTVEFEVIRGGNQQGTPTKVVLTPQRAGSGSNNAKASTAPAAVAPAVPAAPQTIGVLLAPKLLKVEQLQSNNPVIAARLAWEYLASIFGQTLDGIIGVLTTFVTSSKPPPGQSISGPIGLIKQGSNVVATRDLTAVLLFAAGLSVNLGVINALPLPALDGGQLVFVVAEALTGRKVDQRLQEGITSVAVLFLLWVSVSAAIGDVGNIISGSL